MRELVLLCLLATAAWSQPGKYGAFTNADDIGAPPLKGSTQFDAATGLSLPESRSGEMRTR